MRFIPRHKSLLRSFILLHFKNKRNNLIFMIWLLVSYGFIDCFACGEQSQGTPSIYGVSILFYLLLLLLIRLQGYPKTGVGHLLSSKTVSVLKDSLPRVLVKEKMMQHSDKDGPIPTVLKYIAGSKVKISRYFSNNNKIS